MRILFCIILLAILFPRGSPAGELVPDVLAFDPPAFLSADAFVGNNTNSENETRKIWRYAATDNDPRTSQRLLIVSLREIGVATNLENAVTYRQLDDQAFRAEMQAATRSATNVSPVTEVEVGGTAALLASYELPGLIGKNLTALFVRARFIGSGLKPTASWRSNWSPTRPSICKRSRRACQNSRS